MFGAVTVTEVLPKGGVGVGLVEEEALRLVQPVGVAVWEEEAEEVEEKVIRALPVTRSRGVGVTCSEWVGRVETEGLARDTVVRMEGVEVKEGEAVVDTVGVKLPPSTPFPPPPPPEKGGGGVV